MKRLALTMGDPAGIGPEITLKALSDTELSNNVIVIGNYNILEYYHKKYALGGKLNRIEHEMDALSNHINIISVDDYSIDQIDVGKATSVSGDCAYKYIDLAIRMSMEERLQGVITGPINKEALHMAGHHYSGHTEIFAEKLILINMRWYC